jgi:hypothetical protein
LTFCRPLYIAGTGKSGILWRERLSMGRKKNISDPGKAKSNIPAKTHEQQFTEVVGIIQKSRQKALHAVNTELIDLY